MTSARFQTFAFEPNLKLSIPYLHLPATYHLQTESTLSVTAFSPSTLPDLIMLSSSFSPEDTVDFLWQLKNISSAQIVPLIFVVDWSQSLSQVPGTTWGNKIGLLHSLSSQNEVQTTLERLMSSKSK